jgi:glyoxylase-like metal-dependent hydrolase (beta-lactamase superfamily II)
MENNPMEVPHLAANTGVTALQLDMDTGGGLFTVHAALFWDENELILVDTGIAGQKEIIREAVQKKGFEFDKLTKILITHQDRDHIGSLSQLVEGAEGRIQVLAHETGVPFLEGKQPLTKSGTWAEPVHVQVHLQDGQVLPYAGGIQVLYTPGHTPDHTAYYHIPSKTLVSGDMLTFRDGTLQSFDPKFTADPATATESIRKLLPLEISTVIAYHGGEVTERIPERLREILSGE